MYINKNYFRFFAVIFILIFYEINFAQLISIKTVPLASGNQFSIFPSKNIGAGNLTLAINDPWLDPFVNPAKGVNLDRTYFFSSPTMYQISGNNGSARTLPLGLLYKSNQCFGGASLSIQQLESSEEAGRIDFNSAYKKLGDSFSDNMYAFGSLGKYFPKWETSVGASFFYANLDAVQGIELLYPRSQNIEQFGNIYDFRLGFYHKTHDDQEVEAVFVYNRFNMTHEVYYHDWMWNSTLEKRIFENRYEKNLDKSRTQGIHLGYVKPLPNSNWKFGSTLTGNWKSHPKIPNYELMNIPRDPGNSWAYNLGIGFAEIEEDTTFGFEVIYEPIWSNTWADAAQEVTTNTGRTIKAGDKTIENDFTFSNWIIRFGLSKNAYPFGFQLGLQLHSINYSLTQYDYVEEFRRKQKEHWLEWTATWGFMMNFQTFQIRYNGCLLIGTGRPGVTSGGIRTAESSFALADKNILLAPSGDLTLDDAFVFTHRFTVAVPLK